MIWTRTIGGVAQKLPPEVTFVEIRTSDNKLGGVIFLTEKGEVRIAKPGDVDFTTYAGHNRLQPAKLVDISHLDG